MKKLLLLLIIGLTLTGCSLSEEKLIYKSPTKAECLEAFKLDWPEYKDSQIVSCYSWKESFIDYPCICYVYSNNDIEKGFEKEHSYKDDELKENAYPIFSKEFYLK